MATWTPSYTHKILGTLTNGMKVVMTTVTALDAGTDTEHIVIAPLHRVIKFVAGTKTVTTGGIMAWAADATLLNVVTGTPAGSAHDDIFTIISFGY